MADVDAQNHEMLLNSIRRLEPLVREHADEAERNRHISQPVVAALADAGVCRMLVPKTLGGLEVPPATLYRVVEEVARIHGSTGWCAMVWATGPTFVSFLSDEAAETICGTQPNSLVGGGILPPGKAVVHDGAYLVSGRWPYASGCHHSAWLVGVCNVFEGDEMPTLLRSLSTLL